MPVIFPVAQAPTRSSIPILDNILLGPHMNKSLVLASLVAAVALAACGKKEEAPAAAPAPAVAAPAAAVADAAASAASAVADTASAAMGAANAVAAAASAAASAATK